MTARTGSSCRSPTTARPSPPDRLQLLFEPLRRGGVTEDATLERSSLGLGLFIVSQIAEAHGGAMRAESTNGRTTFTMQLPKD